MWGGIHCSTLLSIYFSNFFSPFITGSEVIRNSVCISTHIYVLFYIEVYVHLYLVQYPFEHLSVFLLRSIRARILKVKLPPVTFGSWSLLQLLGGFILLEKLMYVSGSTEYKSNIIMFTIKNNLF